MGGEAFVLRMLRTRLSDIALARKKQKKGLGIKALKNTCIHYFYALNLNHITVEKRARWEKNSAKGK